MNSWLWAMAEAENAEADPCFRVTTVGSDTSVSWQGTCAHEDDDTIEGTLLLTLRDETTIEGDRHLSLSYLASMDGVLEGSGWEVGGTGSATVMETPAGVSFQAEVGGTYDLGEGWATDDLDTSLQMKGDPTDSGVNMTFTGGVTPPDQASLYLWDLVVSPSLCANAPLGVLSVRDPSSVWLDVVFDERCSGCGTVYWADEILGETCPGDAIMSVAERLQLRFSDELTR